MTPQRIFEIFGEIGPFIRTALGRLRGVLPRTKGTTILTLGLLIIVVIFFSLWRGAKKQLDNPEGLSKREAQSVAKKVGELMVLPYGEEPTVATIMDASRLTGQVFFARAKNGDRVLFYTKERLVILYDPVANKIVNVGSVTPGSTPSAQTVENPMIPKLTQPAMQ